MRKAESRRDEHGSNINAVAAKGLFHGSAHELGRSNGNIGRREKVLVGAHDPGQENRYGQPRLQEINDKHERDTEHPPFGL